MRPSIRRHSAGPMGGRGGFPRPLPAFTLVELLVAVLVGTILLGAAVGAIYGFVLHFERTDELTSAQQRGQMVLSLLREPVLSSGYGMPASPDVYRAAFAVQTSLDVLPAWANWEGPLSSAADGGRADALLRSVSAVTTGTGATAETTLSAGTTVVPLRGTPSGLEAGAGTGWTRPSNWAVFGAMQASQRPARVTAVGAGSVTLRGPGTGYTVPWNDTLYALRVLSARSSNGQFLTNLYDGAGEQPRVEGIADFRARIVTVSRTAADGTPLLERVVTVHVLARGGARHDAEATTTCPVGWPSAYWAEVSSEDRHYRLTAVSQTWRVRNCAR